MLKEIKKYQQTKWSLEELLSKPDGPAVEKTISELHEATSSIEERRDKLSPDIKDKDFKKLIKDIERFYKTASVLIGYSQLWFSENTQNQTALAFMGRIDQLLMDAYNRILFFSIWWKGLDDKNAERLLSYAGDFKYFFTQQRLLKPYTLSEKEEKVINIKNVNGIKALITLYEMITNRFVFRLEIEGKKRYLTREELTVYMRDPSSTVREAAYKTHFSVYRKEASVLAQIYTHLVRDWANENISLRGFSSPIKVRNLANDIPDNVVDTILNVCSEEAGVFHKYFKLKAEWLEIPFKKLRRYDIYAPLKKRASKTIPYSNAVDMVLESFYQFSPEVARKSQRIFDENHIDSEIRKGKRNGAFCSSILPKLAPYVLINYTGEPRQVATLAHELGHAVHSLLAAHHSILTFQSVLPMAETASVFSEMLLTDRMLSEETDPDIKRDLLSSAIDDMYATILRQAYFVLFEREAHRMISEGKTIEELNTLYFNKLTQQFGDAVEINEDFQYEWITIPHIYHTPFYCYAYCFGQLLALSLYQQYKEREKEFVPKFLKILAHGGTTSPDQILTEAGINMTNADFWRSGFKVIEEMINRL